MERDRSENIRTFQVTLRLPSPEQTSSRTPVTQYADLHAQSEWAKDDFENWLRTQQCWDAIASMTVSNPLNVLVVQGPPRLGDIMARFPGAFSVIAITPFAQGDTHTDTP